MTRIAIVGAGHIGGNLARLFAAAGHAVTVSFATDRDKFDALAAEIGAAADDPATAAAHAEVVVVSVPWAVVDTAIEQAGGPGALAGKLLIDTTNQFGRTGGRFGVLDLGDSSAAAVNAAKAPQALWVKAFNTLTAGFQASSAGRTGPDRVVMFYATDRDDAAAQVERLIDDAGFDPVRTGTLAVLSTRTPLSSGYAMWRVSRYGAGVSRAADRLHQGRRDPRSCDRDVNPLTSRRAPA